MFVRYFNVVAWINLKVKLLKVKYLEDSYILIIIAKTMCSYSKAIMSGFNPLNNLPLRVNLIEKLNIITTKKTNFLKMKYSSYLRSYLHFCE